MVYRYTEKELADIQKRQAVNLSNFERNSGRGLPKESLRYMERAQGVKLDDNGAPLPLPVPQTRPRKRKLTAPPAPMIAAAEAEAIKVLARGGHPISKDRPTIAPFTGPKARAQAPAIARYRKRAECDGIQFDSQLEMRRYKELKLLKAAGEIKYFLRQVPFHLPGGITARIDFMVVHWIRTGTADADVNPIGWCAIVYEDCKAPAGKRSKGRYNDADRVGVNKRKQIKALYGVEVKLVTKARG